MHTYTSWNNYELQRNLKTRMVNDTFWHYLKHLERHRTRSLNKVCILTLFKTAMRKMIYVSTKSRLNITHPLDLLVWIQQLTWMCQTSNKIIKSMKYVAASYLGRWYIGKAMNDNDSTIDLTFFATTQANVSVAINSWYSLG